MHEVLVNRLGGLSLPRKSVVRLTDRPDMTLDVYRGRKTTIQQQYNLFNSLSVISGQSMNDNERLCAMDSLQFEKILPRAGLELGTARSVGQSLTH